MKKVEELTLELNRNQKQRDLVEDSHSRFLSPRGTETTEREGEEPISEIEGQVSCRVGRREISYSESRVGGPRWWNSW